MHAGALGQFRGKVAAFVTGALVVGMLTRYTQLFGGSSTRGEIDVADLIHTATLSKENNPYTNAYWQDVRTCAIHTTPRLAGGRLHDHCMHECF
jgi:hypothetical protein